jgi:hypothetical protein
LYFTLLYNTSLFTYSIEKKKTKIKEAIAYWIEILYKLYLRLTCVS